MSAPVPDWRQRHAAARSATTWRDASAVNGRTERTPDARGSRASTTPAPSYRDVTSAPSGRPHIELPTAPRQPQHPASQTPSAPSGRPHSERPLDLPNREGASTMAKPAPSFFYACRKFVPMAKTLDSLPEFLMKRCNPLILRGYTLCEVVRPKRQFLPPPEPASSRR
jgi:hypothetical protein